MINGEIIGLEFDCNMEDKSIMRVAYDKNHRIGHEHIHILSEKEYNNLQQIIGLAIDWSNDNLSDHIKNDSAFDFMIASDTYDDDYKIAVAGIRTVLQKWGEQDGLSTLS